MRWWKPWARKLRPTFMGESGAVVDLGRVVALAPSGNGASAIAWLGNGDAVDLGELTEEKWAALVLAWRRAT